MGMYTCKTGSFGNEFYFYSYDVVEELYKHVRQIVQATSLCF